MVNNSAVNGSAASVCFVVNRHSCCLVGDSCLKKTIIEHVTDVIVSVSPGCTKTTVPDIISQTDLVVPVASITAIGSNDDVRCACAVCVHCVLRLVAGPKK